jgi:ribose transport system permease protein
MSAPLFLRTVNAILRWVPLIFLAAVLAVFGALSPRFFSLQNLGHILVQSSWLMVVALGVNFVLLTADVDLSVGAVMYLSAVAVGMRLAAAPAWACLLVAVLVGSLFGAINGLFVLRLQLPAFIATLATTFIGRGLGLFLSSTRMVFAGPAVTNLGRAKLLGAPMPLVLAAVAVLLAWLLLRATPFGSYICSLGADREGAARAGVPSQVVTWTVFGLSGAFAGLGGFISLSQTSAASAAFGQGAEFLAIAAAVLGGTSLFGGRGSLWAPVVGAVLIMTVQNGLVMINANPYAYPLITGAVIFLATLLDSIRSGLVARMGRRQICKEEQP